MGNEKKVNNIMLTLMYDGTSYKGWQRLKDESDCKNTIQGMLETTLGEILGESVHVIGSGRTDSGVHALQQVCNFRTAVSYDADEIRKELNLRLPNDVRVLTANQVARDFHARYDAVSKVYEYRIDTRERENVFTRKYTYPTHMDLDIDRMKEAAKHLIGTHDFKAFSTDRKDGKSTIRTIHDIKIYRVVDKYSSEVRIECCGDGFLHHMIRIIVGTLVEVGEGKRTIISVSQALKSKERSNAGILLYPQGLFLKQVSY
ncbi:MAG: tRNA pseudouridine(38-40) synthase TruA [Clostridiales bacterium]|nr:tRNA pseudouridine(38-40) synthase TruA [Clostridiales bacterium]